MTLVTFCSAAAVEAQSPSRETGQSQQPAGWLFTSSLGLGGSWDDNVLLLNPGSNPLEDYGTPLDGDLTLDYRGRRLSMTTGYGGSFVLYRTLNELNSADHRFRAILAHRLNSRLTLTAQESFIQSPTTEGLELGGVPFARIGSRTNEAGVGFEAVVARHTTLTGGYVLRTVSFDEFLGPNLADGHEHEWTAALARKLSPRLTVGGQFDFRREILSEGLDRFNISSAAATASYDITRALSASGLLGITTLGDGLTHQGQTGTAVEADLVYLARETRLQVGYHHTFVPSFGFGGTFQNEEWLALAHLPLTFASRHLYADGSFVYQDNEPVVAFQPSLKTFQLSAAVGYRASRWATLEMFASRTRQDSQRAGGDLRRNVIGFRVVVTKPMRIR